MPLSDPIQTFGVHGFTAVNKATGLPYGKIIHVLGSANLVYDGDLITNTGGSNPHPVGIERGAVNSEITLNIKEYEPYLNVLAGATIVENAAESSGAATGLANSIGTSVFDATTGVASVAITTASDAKDGRYFIKAVSATTVDVYVDTDISFTNGTDLSYVDNSLKITSSPLTVPGTGGTVAIPNTGLELTGGSGTVAFTTDDVARFDVRGINERSVEITYGQNPVPVEFAGYFYSQKRTNGNYTRIYAPRCVISSMPRNFTENEFSTSDITLKLLYDCSEGFLYKALEFIKNDDCV